jgi:hypothetical protein
VRTSKVKVVTQYSDGPRNGIRGNVVLFPAVVTVFLFSTASKSFRIHSASYGMDTGDSFLGSNVAGALSWAFISIRCPG